MPLRTQRSRRRVDTGLAVFFLGAGILAGIAWVTEAPGFGAAPGGWLTFVGRLTGLIGTYTALTSIALSARLPWVERRLGHDRLVYAHRKLGTTTLLLLIAHTVFITAGYAQASGTSLLVRALDDRHHLPGDAQGNGRLPPVPDGRRARRPTGPPHHALRHLVGAAPGHLRRRDPRVGSPAGNRRRLPRPPRPEPRLDRDDLRRRRARPLRPRAHPRGPVRPPPGARPQRRRGDPWRRQRLPDRSQPGRARRARRSVPPLALPHPRPLVARSPLLGVQRPQRVVPPADRARGR